MTGVWRAWVRLLDRRERATTLAMFRVGVGALLLYSLGSMIGTGLVDVLWVDVSEGGYRPALTWHWLVELAGGASHDLVWGLTLTAAVAAPCVALGLGGRLAPLVGLLAYHPLNTLNPDATAGYDGLLTIGLFTLVLADANATLSLDARWRGGRWRTSAEVPAWPRYLIVFQLVVVYTATGLAKLGATWTPAGDLAALYTLFQEPTWRRFDLRWTAHVYLLTQMGTAITWLWEVTAPLLLVWFWARYTVERGGRLRRLIARWDWRVGFTAVGVVVHGGIFVAVDVGPFSLVSLTYYLALWRPEELERFGARLARTWRPAEAAAG